jgi:hypothetical protein
MSKTEVTVFLCTGKDCTKAWRHVCHGSPEKWLKRRAAEAGLPYKLRFVATECMDRCDDAATCCFVHGGTAAVVDHVHHEDDADRLLASLRSCVERAAETELSPGLLSSTEKNG